MGRREQSLSSAIANGIVKAFLVLVLLFFALGVLYGGCEHVLRLDREAHSTQR